MVPLAEVEPSTQDTAIKVVEAVPNNSNHNCNGEVRTHDVEVLPVNDEVDDMNEHTVAGDQAIYLAFRDVSSFQKDIEPVPKKVKLVIINRQYREDIKNLTEQYGTRALRNKVMQLVRSGVFASPSKAARMFPDISRDISVPSVELKESSGRVVGNETPEGVGLGNWTFEPEITNTDVSTEEIAPIEEAVLVKYGVRGEDEDRVAEEEVRRLVDAVAEVDHVEALDVPRIREQPVVARYSQSEQWAMHLPFPSQHELVVHLQKILEAVCFTYGQEKMPTMLQMHGWSCAEEVQLNTWMDEFIVQRDTFGAGIRMSQEELKGLFQSIAAIRDAAVCRQATDIGGIRKFVVDAGKLVEVLEVKAYKEVIGRIRQGIEKVIDDFVEEEQRVQERQVRELAEIERKRAILDEVERKTRAETGRNLSGCQSSAGLEVEKVLGQAVKEFKAERFFVIKEQDARVGSRAPEDGDDAC